MWRTFGQSTVARESLTIEQSSNQVPEENVEESSHIAPTNRCLLRYAAPSDYDALVAAISAPEFPTELPLASLYRKGKLKAWLDSMSADRRACLFSVDLHTGESCIGQVSLIQREQSSSWNLAFWVHPSYWGRGLALEAARSVVEYAFRTMPIQEIWAGAALWNQRSINTLVKLGLIPIHETTKSDSQNSFRAFSVLRDQWLSMV
jgi:RimJ/RimL family protein N-acetyltransferase